jgi:FkbM family methyltransferase
MLTILRLFGRLRWIPYGIRDRVIRLLADPDTAESYPFTIDFFGLRYSGNFASYIDWVVFFFGAYERETLAFLADAARRVDCDVFVDVGSNVGQHALFMSRHARKVIAVEPYGTVRREIFRKIQDNAIRNIDVHSVGFGEHEGEAPFYAPEGANAGRGTFHQERGKAVGRSIGKLAIVPGDAVLSDAGRIDLIKIDVEGYEPNVLAGLTGTIARDHPVLVFEYSIETRAGFRSFEKMTALVGGGHVFALKPAGSGYDLCPFEFESFEGYVVVIPYQKATLFGLAAPAKGVLAVPA